MTRFGPIHPERPVRRAAVAVAVSLGVHFVGLALLLAWAVSVLAEARKAEAARPKEVALATIDASRWEENKRLVERPAPAAPRRPAERVQPEARPRPEEHSAFATFAPGSEGRPRPAEKEATQAQPSAPAATAGAAGEAGAAQTKLEGDGGDFKPLPGGTLDLQPRPPRASRPLAMRFDPVGKGQSPFTDGTSFAGLTVQTPEAWRFTNFFGRAVEAMNSVYRYELGAPMPPSLHAKWLASPRQGGGCSMTSVSIDAAGRVQEASVRRSSGMPDLDALIVEVIRRTAPFVNVPPELVGERGVYSDTWGLCIMWGGGRG
jgi:TonB family protein